MTLRDAFLILVLIVLVVVVIRWASKRGDDTDGEGPY